MKEVVTEDAVWRQLKQVRDPEFGKPATEMDLIDEIDIEDGRVKVLYHLTAPMCPPPFARSIGKQIREYVSELEGVETVEVKVHKHMHAEKLNKRLAEER